MAANTQSNPVYYSLATGLDTSMRTVALHRRSNHDGFGVYIGEDVPSGLYVVTVDRGSPAADANVQPGDRVLAVNGQTVTSMKTNPKDIVIKAAANAQTLTMTIQSTDLFQTVNIPPLSNTSVDNKVNQRSHQLQQQPLKQTLDSSMDLEEYIRSVLTNENLQLNPSTSLVNSEFIISTDPPTMPSINSHSLSSDHSRTTEGKHKGHHRHHHHHSRRQSHRKHLVTQETQTFVNNTDVNDIPPERPANSSKPQYSSQPTMKTSQHAKPAQYNSGTINQSQESKPFEGKKESNSTALPQSPSSSNSPLSLPVTYQKPLPAATAALFSAAPSASPSNARLTSKKDTRVPSQHMVDVVQAAVRASRTGDQTKKPERSSAQAQQPATQQSTPPSSSSHESTPSSERAVAPTPLNQHSPPPYTISSTYPSADPANKQERVSQGSYSVRNAQENRPQPPARPTTSNVLPPAPGPGLREVHLKRSPNFQGFGFHLQYNKVYYLVQRVESGGPAEQAGLHTSDVVVKINQQVTDKMIHAQFVQIVNASSEVTFLVQPIDEYLRANPQPTRNQKPAPVPAQNDTEKSKSGLARALGKLKSR